MSSMLEWVHAALRPHFHIGWNLFLAVVPLLLALWLFHRTERRGWLWWPLLLVFVAFLPNAAYTLTDIIHFVTEVRAKPQLPTWSVVYILIPKYATFMFLGFQCHVISLIRVGDYLTWIGRRSWIFAAETLLNFLCSVGIYWGRYIRLNSWDIVTAPQKVASQALDTLWEDQLAHTVIAVYFVVLTALYYAVKLVDVAVWQYLRQRRMTGQLAARATG